MYKCYIPQVPTQEPLVECDTYLYVSVVEGTSGRKVRVYPVGSYIRARITVYPEVVPCMVQLGVKRKNSNEFLVGLYHRVVTWWVSW